MNTTTDTRLQRVRRYGTGLRRLSKTLFAVAIVSGIVAIAMIILGRNSGTTLAVGSLEYSADSIPVLARVLGIGGVVLGIGLTLKVLYHLVRLFDLYSRGLIFTDENVRHLKMTGLSILLFTNLWLFDVIVQFILVLSLGDEGTRSLSLGIGENLNGFIEPGVSAGIAIDLGAPVMIVAFSTVIIFFSWIMDVGRELREEQDLVV